MSLNRDPILQGGVDLAKYGVKYTFITLAAVAGVALAVSYYLHRSSYCISEGRFVSDREMITAAIKNEVRTINAQANHGLGRNPGESYLPIRDTTQFELLNPNCCRILTGDEEKDALQPYGILEGVFGDYAVVVGIDHKIRYRDDKGFEQQRAVHSTISVSSCATVPLEVYGRGG